MKKEGLTSRLLHHFIDEGETIEITIDHGACAMCGLCAQVAPDIFRIKDDGHAEVYGKTTKKNRKEALMAVKRCPALAIMMDRYKNKKG